ncbi:hypothetical protein EGP98_01435 [bacterium]|nr:hypothetical protein [bacterium]
MNKNKINSIITISFSIFLLLIVVGISYAAYTYSGVGQKANTITTGAISMTYTESTNSIALSNALPTTDATGKKRKNTGEYFDFTVKSSIKGNTDINYEIAAKEKSGNTFSGKNIKYYLTKVNSDGTETEVMAPRIYYEEPSGNVYTGRPADMMSLFVGNLNQQGDTTINYRLRLWVDENYNPQNDNGGLTYKVKVNVYGQTSDTVAQAEDTYCKDNGFNTLSDCMLVLNNHEASVTAAKTAIKAKGTPNFARIAPNDTEIDGLYMAEDDEGESYYYRGSVKNNYVSFAGFTWRMIRRNGDGSVRMIYSGKSTTDTGEATSIGNSQFNSKYWEPTYVGYKYNEDFELHENNGTTGYTWFNNTSKYNYGTGYTFDTSTKKFTLTGTIKQLTWKDNHDEIVKSQLYSCLNTSCNVVYKVTGYQSDTRMTVKPISYSSKSLATSQANNKNSSIKTTIDNWYKNNLTAYTSKLADETFCNDRSISSGTGYKTDSTTYYGSYNRNVDKKTPSLKCAQDNDKFKVANASAKLDYPVALITADEMAMAGGVFATSNTNYYLYNGQYQWSLSPSGFYSIYSSVDVWRVHPSGSFVPGRIVANSFGVRPVINLKSDTLITKGDGSSLNPFVVE